MVMMNREGKDIGICKSGPLYRHLRQWVLPDLEIDAKNPSFEARPISLHNGVYLFEEKKSGELFIGKFFGSRKMIPENEQRRLLDAEFNNLKILRNKGLQYVPDQVVRPISKAADIGCLLVENYVPGHDLDYYIQKAIYEGQNDRLMKKLSELARFFARLHACTSVPEETHIREIRYTFNRLVRVLLSNELIEKKTAARFLSLFREWRESRWIPSGTSVLVHGDATPTNFIFSPDAGVTAIDLERMHFSDNALDIGMLAAELKHHFAAGALNADASEPFIRHFIACYNQEMAGSDALTTSLNERNPFYMAMGELRIARNEWLHVDHRRWLIEEALRCLQR
jgi:aminoglycoside phosphotransferase (APT) family kinase protein